MSFKILIFSPRNLSLEDKTMYLGSDRNKSIFINDAETFSYMTAS